MGGRVGGVWGAAGVTPVTSIAISVRLVLPTTTPPALRSLSTTGAPCCTALNTQARLRWLPHWEWLIDPRSLMGVEAAEVTKPATSMLSLTAKGRPLSRAPALACVRVPALVRNGNARFGAGPLPLVTQPCSLVGS